MKTFTAKAFILFIVTIGILWSCKKAPTSECTGKVKPTGQFLLKEILNDTSFIADTVFRNNYVQMLAVDVYDSVTWKLGTDPRVWTSPNFTLNFSTASGTIPINFVGKKTPSPQCFPGDSGVYASSKSLTLLEQFDRSSLAISPLCGRYFGCFTDNPSDTFTMRIEYFDSTKYDPTRTGSPNFYWISNIPKGYTSLLGLPYPELQNGQPIYMGYKCFQFGTSSNIVQGRGWISNDSIFISYGNDIVGRKKFIGRKI
jgi:hypothetical protein